MAQRILILGGGFAGLFAAREVKKRFGDAAEVELISAENYFAFQPLLPEVAAGLIAAPHAVTPLRALLRGVLFRKARVDSVDFDAQTVTVFQGVQRRPTTVSYDHLVIALGQVVDLSGIPGLKDHALKMKDLEDARRLRNHVIEKLEHAEVTNLPDVRQEALTFCVIGAGFSGVETVGELKELIDRSLKYYPNIDPADVRVVVVEASDRVLGELPASLGAYAKAKLEARGVEIMLRTGVASATGTRLIFEDGTEIATRTIVATIGNAPSPVVRDMKLEHMAGRIVVERDLRAKGFENVWSLGDCAMIPMKDNAATRDDFAPPTAQFAVREARCLAQNVAAAVSSEALQPFAYVSQGSMASLGARSGVAEVRGVKLSGFLAWILWRLYYLAILPGIGTRLRVLTNWMLDAFSARSVAHLYCGEAKTVRQVHYRAGDRIFEVGNRADGVYSVLSGSVEMTYVEDGKAATRTIGPGEHFGSGILVGKTRRQSTVRAKEDTRVLVLERDAYLQLAGAYPALDGYFRDHLRETYGTAA